MAAERGSKAGSGACKVTNGNLKTDAHFQRLSRVTAHSHAQNRTERNDTSEKVDTQTQQSTKTHTESRYSIAEYTLPGVAYVPASAISNISYWYTRCDCLRL